MKKIIAILSSWDKYSNSESMLLVFTADELHLRNQQEIIKN